MRANVQIVSEAMQTETKPRADVNLHSLHLLFTMCSQSEKAALRGGWLYMKSGWKGLFQTEGEARAWNNTQCDVRIILQDVLTPEA